MESFCIQCKKDLTEYGTSEILNVFNIANPDFKSREKYCSFECIEQKVKDVKNNPVGVFPFENLKVNILGFYKSISGEYAVIVDL